MFEHLIIWVRGAGELGSATAHILHNLGFSVFLSELPVPLAIRRTVTFSDAMLLGETTVEGIKAVRCNLDSLPGILAPKQIPIIEDNSKIVVALQPTILVDSRMLKLDIENLMDRASFTVGLGPGFDAGNNCQAVIETMRGHALGKIIWDGKALPNTKIPGNIGGETVRRVVRSPLDGSLEWKVDFGELIKENDLLGTVNQMHEIRSPLAGIVRGLIAPQVRVKKGLKIADIDPRGKAVDYKSISDKSRTVGRGVLEAILIYMKQTYHKRY